MSSASSETTQTPVTTLELFFDLIFVFTITQVTGLVVNAHQPADYFQAFLVLTMIWWMYAGYVWLTNNVNIQQPVIRLMLLTAMAGFLLMALAVPKVFGPSGLVFGLAYMLVVLIHTVGFRYSDSPDSARAIQQIAPFNLAAAGLLVVAGLMQTTWAWVFWVLAIAVLLSASLMPFERGFAVNTRHFTERHGLVVLIVLGESVIAIGAGVGDQALSPQILLVAVMGLALVAALWWSYFGQDDSRGEHALSAVSGIQRSKMAGLAYGYGLLFVIAGILVVAAGVKQLLAHLHEPYPASVWNLGMGMSLYFFGLGQFRRILGFGQGWLRFGLSGLALLSIPIGLAVGGLLQLIGVVVVMVVMLVLEYKHSKKQAKLAV